MKMPKRGFAQFLSDVLKVGSVFYFIVQILLFVLALLGGNIDIGGFSGAVLLSVITFSLGVILNIALSIERRLYELDRDIRRPRQ